MLADAEPAGPDAAPIALLAYAAAVAVAVAWSAWMALLHRYRGRRVAWHRDGLGSRAHPDLPSRRWPARVSRRVPRSGVAAVRPARPQDASLKPRALPGRNCRGQPTVPRPAGQDAPAMAGRPCRVNLPCAGSNDGSEPEGDRHGHAKCVGGQQ